MNTISGSNILTIGCKFDPPRGGVAQVLYTYRRHVYNKFNFIQNSCDGTLIKKGLVVMFAYIKTFFFLLLHKEVKIVHIHTASYNSFKRSSIFVSLSNFMNRKVVLHIHGGGFKEYYHTNPLWIKSVLEKCDALVALTESWKCFYESLGCTNVKVVSNIIPEPLYRNIDADGLIHLLFLGWIVKEKGIYDLLDVLAAHKKEWENKLRLHVGGNHEVEKLINYIDSNHLEKIVSYEGWVTGEKKIYLLNLMDVFILPSYTEGMPISILEAFSYGKPVISTPVGGIPEMVNNDNGFLFQPGDKKSLEAILISIITDPDKLYARRQHTKETVYKNMPESVAAQLMDVYNFL